MANTTWSSSDKTSSVTLTNGNLTATVASGTAQGVRSIDRQVTGKFYWEYTWNGAPGNICCGVANPNAVLSTLGASVASCLNAATIQGNGVTISNGVQTVSMGGQANGGVVCVALDLINQLLWWRVGAAGQWNASATANPATGVGGVSVSYLGYGLPAHALMNTGTVTSQGVTANFGDTAFVGAVPAGFTSGFTSGASIPTNALTSQSIAEQWLSTDPRAQLTQIAVEQWASVQSTTGQVVVSQMLIEQWASVDMPVSSQAVRVMVLA